MDSSQSQLNQREKHLDELQKLICNLQEHIEQVVNEILENINEQLLVTEMTKRQADDHGSCSVCLEAYKVEDIVGITPCGHIYHIDCFLHWIDNINITCPLCRANLGR